jgi:hypothetical protein
VYTSGYSVAWNNDLEIDSLAIYAKIVKKAPEEILAKNFITAENSPYFPEFIAKIQESRAQIEKGETRIVNIADL